MSASAHISTAESSKPDAADRSRQKAQSAFSGLYPRDSLLTDMAGKGSAEPQKAIDTSPEGEDCSGEEWETIGYAETIEGRKARAIAAGSFQIGRKKKRLFSFHWNVRKY
ncbi:hypothetical protein TruAng_001905 [Truncatella angustata]|nr:hypothetical protein TruAng_001905 [Truncatella angustata]